MLEGFIPDETPKLDLFETPAALRQQAEMQSSLADLMQKAGIISAPITFGEEFEVADLRRDIRLYGSIVIANRADRRDIDRRERRDGGGGGGTDWAAIKENAFVGSSERYATLIEDIERGTLDLNFEDTDVLGSQLFRMQDDLRAVASIEYRINKPPADLINTNLPEGSQPMTQERIDNARGQFSGLASQIVFGNAIDNPEYGGLRDARNTLRGNSVAIHPSISSDNAGNISVSGGDVPYFPDYVRAPDNAALESMGITLEGYQQTVAAEYAIGRKYYGEAANNLLEKVLNPEQEFNTWDVSSLESLVETMAVIDERLEPDRSLDHETDRIEAARQRIYGEELGISQEQMDAWKMEKTVQSINGTLSNWNAQMFDCSSTNDFGRAAHNNEVTHRNIKNWASNVGLDIEEESGLALSEAGIDTDALMSFNARREKLTAMHESGGPGILTSVTDWLKDSDTTGCSAVLTSP